VREELGVVVLEELDDGCFSSSKTSLEKFEIPVVLFCILDVRILSGLPDTFVC
jgi:hypothetical protein